MIGGRAATLMEITHIDVCFKNYTQTNVDKGGELRMFFFDNIVLIIGLAIVIYTIVAGIIHLSVLIL